VRVYQGANNWQALKGIDLDTNEQAATILIHISTEDGVSPHNAAAVFLDMVVDVVDRINRSAYPDTPEGVPVPDFPLRQAIDKILTLRGK
jgi:hypothetical protein